MSTYSDGITLLIFDLKLFSISFTVSVFTVVDCRVTDIVILSSKVLESGHVLLKESATTTLS